MRKCENGQRIKCEIESAKFRCENMYKMRKTIWCALKNESDLVDLETITLVQGKGTGREGIEGKRKGKGREREEKGGDGEDGRGLPPIPSLSEILNTPLGAVVNDR